MKKHLIINRVILYTLALLIMGSIYISLRDVYFTPKTGISKANQYLPKLAGGLESKERTKEHVTTFRGVYYTGPTTGKKVALTFDDGPDNYYTEKVLDILKSKQIHATFFVVANRVKQYPNLVKRMVKEDHVLGNQTWTHPNVKKLSPILFRTELLQADTIIASTAGYHPSLFRFPYGEGTEQLINNANSMGFDVIDWTVDSEDWSTDASKLVRLNVIENIKPGGIVLLHCAADNAESLENTITALPQIIEYLQADGYQFVTIPELLHISPIRTVK